ncbi:MAG: autoinducer binding domain-containing protein [Pseudomonadota bacterium]
MNEVVLKIGRAASFKELSALCYNYFLDRGICHFSYFHFPPIGAIDSDEVKIIVWLGYPDSWIRAYREHGYVNGDPVFRRLAHATKPFFRSSIATRADVTKDEEGYLKLAGECGVKDHLAIPVYGPSGRNGGYGVGFSEPDHGIDEQAISEFQWICQCAHIRYCELLVQEVSEDQSKLSARETQVLRLIARGNTNKQISDELSVTVKTVETYLSRIFHKLDVNDRMTAALRAIARGLID